MDETNSTNTPQQPQLWCYHPDRASTLWTHDVCVSEGVHGSLIQAVVHMIRACSTHRKTKQFGCSPLFVAGHLSGDVEICRVLSGW